MAPAVVPSQWLKNVIFKRNGTQEPLPIYPLTHNNCKTVATFNGSAALHQATVELDLQAGDTVLLPAYCCGAEIGPFIYTGCHLQFYDADEQLNAQWNQIYQQLTNDPTIKVLLVTHYFGFPQVQIEELQQLCITTNTALLEDCAHALFGQHAHKPLGSFGSCSIFSPRKTVALTEGGLCVSNHSIGHADPTGNEVEQSTLQPDFVPWLHRLCYSIQQHYRSYDSTQLKRWQSLLGIALCALPMMTLKVGRKMGAWRNSNWATADVEGDNAVGIYTTSMSTSMYRLLQQADAQVILETRRKHYKLWLAELNDDRLKTIAKPLFSHLPEQCCPLYFPLVVDNPQKLVADLALDNIESFHWWQHMHPAVNWPQFPKAQSMKQRIVALPLHHQLTTAQVKHVARSVKHSLLSSK
ncbi:MAG: DegT/DnrJ/EryC1/StrS family aminotransferase [Gammaproteobacteria bacterium]|nr:DegT/DnrJ/EryC1/StrS family aminotransferase [Gammaproteobacteria bacterium]